MTDLKKLPLHDAHAAAGARFAPFAGYEMPVRYTTIKEEHAAVRERVGIFDVSHMGEVFLRGTEALSAANRLFTNDLTRLEAGQAMYTAMCRPSGGIIDDLIVYRLSDTEILVCVNASNRQKDFEWIRENLVGDAVAVDESDEWVQLAVQGPRAVAVLTKCSEGAAEVHPFRAARVEIAGHEVLLARTGYTGEDGFELYIPVPGAQAVLDAIVAAGEPHGIAFCGLGARDTLRLEAGFCLYGNDIDEKRNPLEAGLGWVVKLDGDDFIGRAAIAEFKAQGARKRLFPLELLGRGVLRADYPLFDGDTEVGRTTSGGIALSLDGKSIGLAYLSPEHTPSKDRPTVELEAEIRGRRIPVRVVRRPFYTKPR